MLSLMSFKLYHYHIFSALCVFKIFPLMSEINAVMTGGFATVAGTVLGAYIG